MDSTLSSAISPDGLQDAIIRDVQAALAEDIGDRDLTAELLPSDQQATATIICREPAIVCGIP